MYAFLVISSYLISEYSPFVSFFSVNTSIEIHLCNLGQVFCFFIPMSYLANTFGQWSISNLMLEFQAHGQEEKTLSSAGWFTS